MADVQPCPDVSRLQRLLDGLLTDEEQAHLNAHLADCMACQQHLDELISRKDFWADVARNLKLAQAEIEAGTPTCCAPQSGEALDRADDDLTLEFLERSDKPDSLGRLGHYEVLEVVGRGGMGIVLRAFDEKLHRVVAIKVMAPRLAATSPPRKRFLREARAAAQVRHENVVDIHAVEEQPIPHLVMEYVPGESLQQRLDRIGPLEVPDVLRIGQQIARGLAAAHAQGLIHRDVKPGNVLLEKGVEERVKITDFGLARAADDASLTQSGIIAGTPLYMAPEQAQGGVIDHRADLFSLGSVLYTMASGRPPFRAPTSLAVLKRVVEDTPRPIQEIIPEVPQWLCDVISRLHAKRPEDRFQSAKEVTELLGQRLTLCDAPQDSKPDSAVSDSKPLVRKSTPSEIRNPKSQISWRPWLIAASVVLLLICVLSLSEATGVTQVAATVVRLLTPGGTLIVETNDPGVKVTVEGDGGLVITGAGLEEIRVRPGSYRVHADRDGKPLPLDKDLVTVARGGREIVKVKLERAPAAVAKAEKGAFVLLGGKGVAERKFDTLAEAVTGASDGDTIEVRGNGPFLCDRINITQAVTIRAGEGFRPVIYLTVATKPFGQAGLASYAPLVLEGLEFRVLDPDEMNGKVTHTVIVPLKALRVANCRFSTDFYCLANWGTSPSSVLEFRNCEFLGSNPDSRAVAASFASGQKVILENCVSTMPCTIDGGVLKPKEPSFQLTRNTFRAFPCAVEFVDATDRTRDLDDAKKGNNVLLVEASGNLFDCNRVLVFTQHPPGKILSPADAQKYLAQVVGWKGERNLYSVAGQFLTLWSIEKGYQDLAKPLKELADWKQFWTTAEDNSIEGLVRYQGGDILAKVKLSPEKVSPEDFRLRPDSAGYRAGPDGKDLGADVDLVGPGAAYERWKQTPEYQQWLKDTGQLENRAAAKAETGAFVLLGGQGVAQRNFDTLADAVQHAGDGETMEIRGNGPFVTKPIAVYERSLIIRAGAGFRPLIMLDPDEPNDCMIRSNAPLVLEGLELQWVNLNSSAPETRGRLIKSSGPKAQLHAANCRFLMNRRDGANQTLICMDTWDSLATSLRNCQCIVAGHGNVGGTVIQSNYSRIVVDNCLCHGTGVKLQIFQEKPSTVLLSRNTILPLGPVSISLAKQHVLLLGDGSSPPIEVEMSGNVVATPAIWINQWRESLDQKQDLSASAAEFLKRLVAWRGRGNCFLMSEKELVELAVDFNLTPSTPPVKTLDDWKRFWSLEDLDAQLAQARFQGGNLAAKGAATPELLMPEDYRLREGSPGYQAGPDGKDLGADVDLVGPGAAYERWKQTPEYQEWLKEIGQEK